MDSNAVSGSQSNPGHIKSFCESFTKEDLQGISWDKRDFTKDLLLSSAQRYELSSLLHESTLFLRSCQADDGNRQKKFIQLLCRNILRVDGLPHFVEFFFSNLKALRYSMKQLKRARGSPSAHHVSPVYTIGASTKTPLDFDYHILFSLIQKSSHFVLPDSIIKLMTSRFGSLPPRSLWREVAKNEIFAGPEITFTRKCLSSSPSGINSIYGDAGTPWSVRSKDSVNFELEFSSYSTDAILRLEAGQFSIDCYINRSKMVLKLPSPPLSQIKFFVFSKVGGEVVFNLCSLKLYTIPSSMIDVKSQNLATLVTIMDSSKSSLLSDMFVNFANATGSILPYLYAAKSMITANQVPPSFEAYSEGLGKYILKVKREYALSAGDSALSHKGFTETNSKGVKITDNTVESVLSSSHATVAISFRRLCIFDWTFRFDYDKDNDEMTCFGASDSLTPESSGYDSCPNFFMCRAYNGVYYQKGAKLSTSHSAIHPGSLIRFRFDPFMQTISISVDNEPLQPAFHNVRGPVYPTVCFYNKGRKVTLSGVSFVSSVFLDSPSIDPSCHDTVEGRVSVSTFVMKSNGNSETKNGSSHFLLSCDDILEHEVSPELAYHGRVIVSPTSKEYNKKAIINLTIFNGDITLCSLQLRWDEQMSFDISDFGNRDTFSYKLSVEDTEQLVLRFCYLFSFTKSSHHRYFSLDNSGELKKDKADVSLQLMTINDYLVELGQYECSQLDRSLYWYESSIACFRCFFIVMNFCVCQKNYSLFASFLKLLTKNIEMIYNSNLVPALILEDNQTWKDIHDLLHGALLQFSSFPEHNSTLTSLVSSIFHGLPLFFPDQKERTEVLLNYIKTGLSAPFDSSFFLLIKVPMESSLFTSLFSNVSFHKNSLESINLIIQLVLQKSIAYLQSTDDSHNIEMLNIQSSYLRSYHCFLYASLKEVNPEITQNYFQCYLTAANQFLEKFTSLRVPISKLRNTFICTVLPIVLGSMSIILHRIPINNLLFEDLSALLVAWDALVRDRTITEIENSETEAELRRLEHRLHCSPMKNLFNRLYTGERDSISGDVFPFHSVFDRPPHATQVGFIFKPVKDLVLFALGRAVAGNPPVLHCDHTLKLMDPASKKIIITVLLTSNSPLDELGYAYEKLSCPILLKENHQYRLTSSEIANRGDPWYSRENASSEFYCRDCIQIERDCLIIGKEESFNSLPNTGYGMVTLLFNEKNENFFGGKPELTWTAKTEASDLLHEGVKIDRGSSVESKPLGAGSYQFVLYPVKQQDTALKFDFQVQFVSNGEPASIAFSSDQWVSAFGKRIEKSMGIHSNAFITVQFSTKSGSFVVQSDEGERVMIVGPEHLNSLFAPPETFQPITEFSIHMTVTEAEVHFSFVDLDVFHPEDPVFTCYKMLSLVTGQAAGKMISSTPFIESEAKLGHYLGWSLFSGGVEPDYPLDQVSEDSDLPAYSCSEYSIPDPHPETEDNSELSLFKKWILATYLTAVQQQEARFGVHEDLELRFLQAMIKHTGSLVLVHEVEDYLSEGAQPVPESDFPPSSVDILRSFAKRIYELRHYLLNQKNVIRQSEQCEDPTRDYEGIIQNITEHISFLMCLSPFYDSLDAHFASEEEQKLKQQMELRKSAGDLRRSSSFQMSSPKPSGSPQHSITSTQMDLRGDEDENEFAQENSGIAAMICRSCLYFIQDLEISPKSLLLVYKYRNERATMRIRGLQQLTRLLSHLTSPTAVYSCLLYVRSAFSDEKKDSSVLTYHHYLSKLEGIQSTIKGEVQKAYIEFFLALHKKLSESIESKNVLLVQIIIWTLTLDYQPADLGMFELMFKTLESVISISTLDYQQQNSFAYPWSHRELMKHIANGAISLTELQRYLQSLSKLSLRESPNLFRTMKLYLSTLQPSADSSYHQVPPSSGILSYSIRTICSNYYLYLIYITLQGVRHEKTTVDVSHPLPAHKKEKNQSQADLTKRVLIHLTRITSKVAEFYREPQRQRIAPSNIQIDGFLMQFIDQLRTNSRRSFNRAYITKSMTHIDSFILMCSVPLQMSLLTYLSGSLSAIPPSSCVPGVLFVKRIITLAGSYYLQEPREFNDPGRSYTKYCLLCESVCLIRTLIRSAHWRDDIVLELKNIVSRFCQEQTTGATPAPIDSELLAKIAVVFDILGGLREIFRVGGKVRFMNEELDYPVLDYSPSSPEITILMKSRCVVSQLESVMPTQKFMNLFQRHLDSGHNLLQSMKIRLLQSLILGALAFQTTDSQIVATCISHGLHKSLGTLAALPILFHELIATEVLEIRLIVILNRYFDSLCTDPQLFYYAPTVTSSKKDSESSSLSKSESEESPEEQKRRAILETMTELGFDLSVCRKALERNRNDPDAAVNWLMSGDSEVESLISEEREHCTDEDRRQALEFQNKLKDEASTLNQVVDDGDFTSPVILEIEETTCAPRRVIRHLLSNGGSQSSVIESILSVPQLDKLIDTKPRNDPTVIFDSMVKASGWTCRKNDKSAVSAIRKSSMRPQTLYSTLSSTSTISAREGTLVSLTSDLQSGVYIREKEGVLLTKAETDTDVEVLLFDYSSCISYSRMIPSNQLSTHRTLFGKAISSHEDLLSLIYHYSFSESIRYSRSILHNLFFSWPESIPLDRTRLGMDNQCLVKFVKFLISDCLPIQQHKNSDDYQKRLVVVTRLLAHDPAFLRALLEDLKNSSEFKMYEFSIEECTSEDKDKRSGKIEFPDSDGIQILFDLKSLIPEDCLSIEFFRDADFEQELATIKEPTSILLNQSAIYWRLEENSSDTTWNFKWIMFPCFFEWTNEEKILEFYNFEFLYWLTVVILPFLKKDSFLICEIIDILLGFLTVPSLNQHHVFNALRYILHESSDFLDPSSLTKLDQITILRSYTVDKVWLEWKKEAFSISPLYLYICEFLFQFKLLTSAREGNPLIPLMITPDISLRLEEEEVEVPGDSESLESTFQKMALLVHFLHDGSHLNPSIFSYVWAHPEMDGWETDHPISRRHYIKTLLFKGATELTIIFDPRSQIPDGTKYSFKIGSILMQGCSSLSKDVLHYPGDTLDIDVDATEASPSNEFGVSFVVIPQVMDHMFLGPFFDDRISAVRKLYLDMNKWDSVCDRDIIRYLNVRSKELQIFSNQLSVGDIKFSDTDFTEKYQSLSSVPLLSLYTRVKLLLYFNRLLYRSIGLINFENMTEAESLPSKINSLGEFICFDIKERILSQALQQTASHRDISASVTGDNSKHIDSTLVKNGDPLYSECMFMQMYKILKEKDPALYRQPMDSKGRIFDVSYTNESGIDHGGLFRDVLSQGVDDLFSPYFTLFIPCANSRNEINANMDKFIPNPSYTNDAYLDIYYFVGCLMGCSLRHNLALSFEFPSVIWKQLVGITPDRSDIADYDTMTFNLLESLRQATPEEFETNYSDLCFDAINAKGEHINLYTKGGSTSISYDQRLKYISLVEEFLLNEFNVQMKSMQKGFSSVVPVSALSLFTWNELELLVCGNPDVSVDILKEHTTYSGYSSKDEVIQNFWIVFQELTQMERRQFIRFAWGRSRLPTEKKWSNNFELHKAGQTTSLPCAHTCFFTVELPPYPTLEAMRKAIVTCVHYGVCGVLNS